MNGGLPFPPEAFSPWGVDFLLLTKWQCAKGRSSLFYVTPPQKNNAAGRWHFRKDRVTHQAWQPYLVFGGSIAWVGLINARLHPALALCFIVPFMPGPDMEKLAMLDNEVMVEAA